MTWTRSSELTVGEWYMVPRPLLRRLSAPMQVRIMEISETCDDTTRYRIVGETETWTLYHWYVDADVEWQQ